MKRTRTIFFVFSFLISLVLLNGLFTRKACIKAGSSRSVDLSRASIFCGSMFCVSVCLFVCLFIVYALEVLARSGADYVVVDMQHGVMDLAEVVSIVSVISLAQAVAIVRVPSLDNAIICKCLDAGAHGKESA